MAPLLFGILHYTIINTRHLSCHLAWLQLFTLDKHSHTHSIVHLCSCEKVFAIATHEQWKWNTEVECVFRLSYRDSQTALSEWERRWRCTTKEAHSQNTVRNYFLHRLHCYHIAPHRDVCFIFSESQNNAERYNQASWHFILFKFIQL